MRQGPSSKAVELDLPFSGALPDRIRPMLPMLAAEPFDSPAHCFEVAWDGVRAIAAFDGSQLRLTGRTGRDLTAAYPEAQGLGAQLPPDTMVDGELIVADREGRPDPPALQERQQAQHAYDIAAGVRSHPVTYVVYDVLFRRGRSLLAEPLSRRRQVLKETLASTGSIYVPGVLESEGIAFFWAAQEKGLQGIVAKRLDSGYLPGRQHAAWLLIQAVRQADFVVLAFTPGRGEHPLESLTVGSYDGSGYRPVGRVSGGYDHKAALRLRRLLDPLPPGGGEKGVEGGERWAGDDQHWVEPRVVVSVKFSEWDGSGFLRFPIYCGLQSDVSPTECVRLPLVQPAVPVRPRVAIELPTLPLQ
jgi:bifunctional non-homologous end joining protein LigD